MKLLCLYFITFIKHNAQPHSMQTLEQKTKLAAVRSALRENPNVVLVGTRTENYLPGREGYFSHTVDFYAAPKVGIYSADELQKFMMHLLPGVEPTCKDNFGESGSELRFGKLYFDEKIGEERITRICTITDRELLGTIEIVEGQVINGYVPKIDLKTGQVTLTSTQDYTRRTWVRIYPNEQLARDVFEGKIDAEHYIYSTDLRSYQRIPTQLRVSV